MCATCEIVKTNCTGCTGNYRSSNLPNCECNIGYFDVGIKDCESNFFSFFS